MNSDNPDQSQGHHSRREFLVRMGGISVGAFIMPVPDFGGSDLAPSAESPTVRELISKPSKVTRDNGSILLVWTESDGSKTESMMWNASTPEDIADAQRFYEAMRDYDKGPAVTENQGGIVGSVFRSVQRFFTKKDRSPAEKLLIAAILEDPEKSSRWLDYARWLENRKDPQGEFMRITWEMRGMNESDPHRKSMDRRWMELLKKFGEQWVKPLNAFGLRPAVFGMPFPGLWLLEGAITTVEIDKPGILPQRAERFFEAAPLLLEIEFNCDQVDVAGLSQVSQLKQIRSLNLSSSTMSLDELRVLVRSPNLMNLKKLNVFGNKFAVEGSTALAASDLLGQLTHLNLGDCTLGDAGFSALAASGKITQLQSLVLTDNELSSAVLPNLAALEMDKLTELDLSSNTLEVDGIQALRSARFLQKLNTLNLDYCYIGPEGAKQLAELSFQSLRELELSLNEIGTEGFLSLGASPIMSTLRVLNVGANQIETSGVMQFSETLNSCVLEELDIHDNEVGDDGVRALSNCSALTQLKKLNLSENNIRVEGAAAIAGSACLHELKELNLSDNEIGAGGAKALAASPYLKQLNFLFVDEETVQEAGKNALIDRYGDDVVSFN